MLSKTFLYIGVKGVLPNTMHDNGVHGIGMPNLMVVTIKCLNQFSIQKCLLSRKSMVYNQFAHLRTEIRVEPESRAKFQGLFKRTPFEKSQLRP